MGKVFYDARGKTPNTRGLRLEVTPDGVQLQDTEDWVLLTITDEGKIELAGGIDEKDSPYKFDKGGYIQVVKD